jgi:uncharacterized protein YcnI
VHHSAVRIVLAGLVLLALALVPAASAHVTVRPAFLEDGETATLSFDTPNEREEHATVALSVSAPAGLRFVSAEAPSGWRVSVGAGTVTWSGGRLEGDAVASFPVRVRARTRAGGYAFSAEQRYDDGATVRWRASITVLPASGAAAPNEHPGRAIAAGVAGLVVIAATLLALGYLRRRRALQER